MYIDPRILNTRSRSDVLSKFESTLDSRHTDIAASPSHTSLQSIESAQPLVPTDSPAEITPNITAHSRKTPSLVSSHIGIFLSAIVGICACLIFLYWLHGCFNLGPPARTRPSAAAALAPLSRPGILSRLGKFGRDTQAKLGRKSIKNRLRKERPHGSHWNASGNSHSLHDASPTMEMRSHGVMSGIPGLNLPEPVLGSAHCQVPSSHWQPYWPRRCADGVLYAPRASANAVSRPSDITATNQGRSESTRLSNRLPGLVSFVMTPARTLVRSERRWTGPRTHEESYFIDRTRGCYATQTELGTYADDWLRTPPPQYEEMCRDDLRRGS